VSVLRQGKAEVLTIYLGESDQWHGSPLYAELVRVLREHGCAGATVTRAILGFGAGKRLHEDEVWHLSSDAPMILQAVDQPERLRRLLPQLTEMLPGGLITLHETTVLKYTHARRKGLPTRLSVRQIMETDPTTVTAETSVATVIDVLLTAAFRVLPVVDTQHHLLGVIGTRDLITAGLLPVRRGVLRTAEALGNSTADALIASVEEAKQRPEYAEDIMNRQVRTIKPEQTVREAAQIMLETGLHSLPVVDAEGRLVGMLTRADLLQLVVTSPLMSSQASSLTQPLRQTGSLPSLPFQEQPVTDVLRTEISTVEEETPMDEVVDALLSSPLKRVLVIDHAGHLCGIISDVDVLTRQQAPARQHWLDVLAGWARGKPGRIPTTALQTPAGHARVAREVMNSEVVSVETSATIQEAVETMLRTGRKVLPVLDHDGRVQGVVGRSDLLPILIEG
jgi:CBS domain-containing protein